MKLGLLASAIVVLLVLSGCSSDDEPASPSTTDATPLSLEPAGDPNDIDVVIGSVELDRISTFAPEGWAYDEGTDAYSDPTGELSWQVTRRCPEPCQSRTDAEWINAVGDVVTETFEASGLGEDDFETDDLEPGRRFVVADDGNSLVAVMARWVSGSSEMIWCRTSGPAAQAVDLAAVLEFACDNTQAALE